MKPTLEQLIDALRSSWAADTAYDADGWGEENPARGQCVVSSLVVQDYFGGSLQRYKVEGSGLEETHYANLLDGGAVLDTTASQYGGLDVRLVPTPANLKGFATVREKCLTRGDTRQRYELLKRRVDTFLR